MYTVGYVLLTVVFALTTFFGGGSPVRANAAHAAVAPHRQALPNSWRRLPYSSGVIFSRAVRLGLIHPTARQAAPKVRTNLQCSPAPCVYPNSVAGSGAQPINETPIASDPANHKVLLTGGNDYNCSSLTGYFYSTDGGTTWTSTCGTLVGGSSGGDGDPIVAFDLNGIAYRGGIDAEGSGGVVVVDHSTDGTNWSTPVVAVTPFFSGGLTDKPWMQIDTSPQSPRKNTIYVSTTQFDNSSDTEITVSHSTDGGATWKQTALGVKQNYPVVNQFSDIAVAKDGTVYVSFQRCTANGPADDCGGTMATMLVVKSTDGGNTWSQPMTISTPMLAPDTGCGFYGCVPNTGERLSNIPVIAADDSSNRGAGDLYEIDYSYGTYCKVEVTRSRDGGMTWSNPLGIAPASDKHDQFFQWISTNPQGIVGATWLDRRNDPANVSYEEFGDFFNPSTGMRSSNVQIASQLSNPNNDGFGGTFMGDYTGNTFAGFSFYASWTDTRSGNAADEVGGVRL